MKKMWNWLFKENRLSTSIFWGGIVVIPVILWFVFRNLMFGYYFWMDKIHNGVLLHWLYIIIALLDEEIVPLTCRNKSIARMVVTGVTPMMTVLALRWYFTGFVAAGILLTVLLVYSVIMTIRVIATVIRGRRKKRVIAIGANNVLLAVSVISFIGMAGYCLTGMDTVVIKVSGTTSQTDNGRAWDANRDILQLWQEETYDCLSNEEKKELFQELIGLECLYWGIEPVKLEVETYEASSAVQGYYIHEYYVISIRKEMFDMPREEVLDTLLHECHHAYAHTVVDSIDWDDKAVQQNKNLRFYKEAYLYKEGIENHVDIEEDFDGYYNNFIEVAARAYAKEWMPNYLEYIDSI